MMLPGWLKPLASRPDETAESQELAVSADPIFLREVGQWDARWQRMLFQVFVPSQLLVSYGIDPVRLTDAQGRPVAFTRQGADHSSFRLELYHSGDAVDPMAEVELSDTQFNQIEFVWVSLQDPHAPRFDIDKMPNGESTMRGAVARNLLAETQAKAAGLAPGQTRAGLGLFHTLLDRVETVMLCLNQREFHVQPLFYHTAVLFERNGFGYVRGETRMNQIHAGFALGGRLRARLDGSTPFRQPEQADSIIGRSWAIHDGILDEPWDGIRLVKHVGENEGVDTCPDVPW